MEAITDIFVRKEKSFSFEVFPVSTPEAYARLLTTLEALAALSPDFISCTYGAGGGNRERTLDVVEHIQKKHRIPAMAHLTCVGSSRKDIEGIFAEFEKRGIRSILALRGDSPKQTTDSADPPKSVADPVGDFRYSSDLVAFIRKHFGKEAAIGVAGFPEKHLLAPDADSDARYLREKIKAGADFVITQLFFDNKKYFEYVERLRKLGVEKRVIPGILPVTDYEALKRFCDRCGAGIPEEIHKIFGPLAGDPAKTVEAGIEFAVKQCKELLAGRAPGVHFYALNKIEPVATIWKRLQSR